jgi:hypothetical protein
MVIGGDTGKRSTFTLCYNFALQFRSNSGRKLDNKLQAQSILDLKYGTHKALKNDVRNYKFAMTCIKHFTYLATGQRY